MHVKSFYTGQHEELRQKSLRYCNTLKEAGYAASLDPYINGSQSFPNHILCDSNDATTENNYIAVRADFMLFARSDAYAHNISKTIDLLSGEIKQNAVYEVGVDIRDVSHNPVKIWNWILHCTESRLAEYDYVWFIDGDISLKSLNWQAFWQQVKLMRPKITQAGTIGNGREGHATVHPVLRFKEDSRLIAAEVPILEVQSPLLEVETWLGFRNFLVHDPEPMEQMADGAEQCFDMGWCHYAKNNLTGVQSHGPISNLGYHDYSPTLSLTGDSHKGRGCVVLYQTPIVHISRMSRVTATTGRFGIAQALLCRYFRLKVGVIGKMGLKTVYELFNAPKPSYVH
ncbi:hypothetical protein ACHAXR_006675 [Thalassiosira sp. AJA248-18]